MCSGKAMRSRKREVGWAMSTLLFGVTAKDPITFVAVAALLTLVAFIACYIPARCATKGIRW